MGTLTVQAGEAVLGNRNAPQPLLNAAEEILAQGKNRDSRVPPPIPGQNMI